MILPWKMLFILLTAFGTFYAISASSWLMVWVGLEINMLAILTLLTSFSSPREKEAALKYFLVQALASTTLLSSALTITLFYQKFSNHTLTLLIFTSLAIKMGAAPFHWWLPQVLEGLSWFNTLLILIWQKIAPSILLLGCFEMSHLSSSAGLLLLIILSAITGGLGGLSQLSSRKILAFSSINHLGWSLGGLIISPLLWLGYFSVYSALLSSLILNISTFNISSINASKFLTTQQKTSFFTTLLSFGGLPPLLGFLPKWMIVSKLASLAPLATLTLVITSLFSLFFYLNMTFSAFFNKSKTFLPLQTKTNWVTGSLVFNLLSFIPLAVLFVL